MESPAAVIDVSTECKGVVRRDESRELDDPFSTCSASFEGSVVRYFFTKLLFFIL